VRIASARVVVVVAFVPRARSFPSRLSSIVYFFLSVERRAESSDLAALPTPLISSRRLSFCISSPVILASMSSSRESIDALAADDDGRAPPPSLPPPLTPGDRRGDNRDDSSSVCALTTPSSAAISSITFRCAGSSAP
jgi:hypothetical protein